MKMTKNKHFGDTAAVIGDAVDSRLQPAGVGELLHSVVHSVHEDNKEERNNRILIKR